jgi:16S rRNA (uracil1498-N3)-methyltransferase
MARLNSFYLPPALWREPFFLADGEAHHLLRVLRAKPKDTIRLFDGQGRWGIFQINAVTGKKAELTALSITETPAPASPLTLAVGWSKSLRRGYLLEKTVELGAAAVWFWQAERSQGQIPTESETWQRQTVAAAKQCGAPWLPEIRIFSGASELIRTADVFGSRVLCWEREETKMIDPEDLIHPTGSIVVLGPEGGLSADEAGLFQEHGFQPRSLGPHILRFETAALFVLSLHLWARQT